MLAASNELLNGDIGAATNTIYALVLTSSFFFIFYVAINVIEVINNPAEATERRITFMVGAFVAFLVGTYFLVWCVKTSPPPSVSEHGAAQKALWS